jgi:hypothetical protein
MVFFDRFRRKWKHPDPTVRLEAVRALRDQKLLGEIATNDASDDVRLAAVETLKDEGELVRLAIADHSCAAAAGAKVTDPVGVTRIAQQAARPAVRQHAIERIKDRTVLLRIAAVDTEASLRALARVRAGGADPAWAYLRGTISKLPVSPRNETTAVEFSGTLDEVCKALAQDPRFFVNGEVVEEESHGTASVADPTQAPWTIPVFPLARTTIRFLAQTRTPWLSATSGPQNLSFYHVKVWRTGEDRYDAVATVKQPTPTSDPITWSRASGSGPHDAAAAEAGS